MPDLENDSSRHPALWVHLYHVAKVPGLEPYSCKLEGCIRLVDVRFLIWWLGNSQSIPLIFCFEFNFTNEEPYNLIRERRIREKAKSIQ
jgi:hypothetical protein